MSSIDFQPTPPDPVDPDDALADLESRFQAVTDPPEVLVVEDEPGVLGTSWAFDWGSGRFVTGPGGHSPLATRGMTTLIMWMEKCLRTGRGAHPIHPEGYGLDMPGDLIGRVLTTVTPVEVLEERIRDALTFHPRIVDVEDFDADISPGDEAVFVSFTVVTDDDTRLPVDSTLTQQTVTEF